jgi:hypothetical protein
LCLLADIDGALVDDYARGPHRLHTRSHSISADVVRKKEADTVS